MKPLDSIATTQASAQVVDREWVPFQGQELEGIRPRTMCASCRARLAASFGRSTPTRTICFRCYRAELARQRALKAAGEINTASEARFQSTLPFEPVDAPRLEMLKVERAAARLAAQQGAGQFADRRRHAQI